MKKYTNLQEFTKYVTLNVFGMIGLSCYILADTFFIAKALGPNGLAALNFSIAAYCLMHGTGLMLGVGGATKYSILNAQKEEKKVHAVFTHTLLIGLILGLCFLFIGLFFTPQIATLLGANNDTYELTTTYLKTLLLFSPFFITNNVILAFVRNDKNPKLSMTGMIVGSLSNIVLDYILMFPLQLGMFGAALATGISPIISLLILSTHFIRKKNNFHLTKCIVSFRMVSNILSLGLSAFITELSSGIVLFTFNIVILGITGNIGVAAYGIVANIALVVISIFTGISQGLQPLVSTHFGKKDYRSTFQFFRYALTLSVVLALVIYLVSFVFSEQMVAVFNTENNQELGNLAMTGISVYFIGFLFAGCNIISAAFLSAVNRPNFAFFISIIRGFIGILPFVYLFSRWFDMNGVWISFVATEILAFGFSIFFIIRTKKHLI